MYMHYIRIFVILLATISPQHLTFANSETQVAFPAAVGSGLKRPVPQPVCSLGCLRCFCCLRLRKVIYGPEKRKTRKPFLPTIAQHGQ